MDDIVALDGLPHAAAKVRREAARGVRRCGRTVTPEQLAEIEARHAAGASRRELAEIAGVSVAMLGEMWAYGCLAHLPRRQGRGGGRPAGWHPSHGERGPGPGDPSPREIARRAAEVRARWGPHDAQIRSDRMAPADASERDHLRLSGIRIYRASDLRFG
jgi:hypothetical protein